MTEKTSRRSFLDWLIGAGVIGWLVSVLYPTIRYLRPLNLSTTGEPVKLSKEAADKLDKERFAIVHAGAARVIVFDAGDQLRALDAKCTHEGCTVRFVPGDSLVWCACHNGRFDLDGRVISGPPPRPLGRWLATRDAQGNVTVTREKT